MVGAQRTVPADWWAENPDASPPSFGLIDVPLLRPNVPQQSLHGNDCGSFLMAFLDFFTFNPEFNWDQRSCSILDSKYLLFVYVEANTSTSGSSDTVLLIQSSCDSVCFQWLLDSHNLNLPHTYTCQWKQDLVGGRGMLTERWFDPDNGFQMRVKMRQMLLTMHISHLRSTGHSSAADQLQSELDKEEPHRYAVTLLPWLLRPISDDRHVGLRMISHIQSCEQVCFGGPSVKCSQVYSTFCPWVKYWDPWKCKKPGTEYSWWLYRYKAPQITSTNPMRRQKPWLQDLQAWQKGLQKWHPCVCPPSMQIHR